MLVPFVLLNNLCMEFVYLLLSLPNFSGNVCVLGIH